MSYHLAPPLLTKWQCRTWRTQWIGLCLVLYQFLLDLEDNQIFGPKSCGGSHPLLHIRRSNALLPVPRFWGSPRSEKEVFFRESHSNIPAAYNTNHPYSPKSTACGFMKVWGSTLAAPIFHVIVRWVGHQQSSPQLTSPVPELRCAAPCLAHPT
jgi:hypothetical protein